MFSSNSEILNNLWVEKYSPTKIEDLILSDEYRAIFQKAISTKNISNYLFYGPPGSGKTSLGKIITSKNGVLNNPKDNLLLINGNSKKERNIQFTDEVIEPFLRIPPIGNDNYRIVFIDEGDYLTDDAIHSLRHIIEKYQRLYGRFILTCNYISKIPEAIISRFQVFQFKTVSKNFIFDFCENILEEEDINYNDNDLNYIIDELYPDIRRIIHFLEQNIVSNKLTIDRNKLLSDENIIFDLSIEIIDLVRKGLNQTAKEKSEELADFLFLHQGISFRDIYIKLFNEKELGIILKIIVEKYSETHRDALIPEIHYMALIYSLMQKMNELKNLLNKEKK